MKSFAETCGIHDEAREAAAHHTARLIEASGLELVRFGWCDLHGVTRVKTLTAAAAVRAMHEGVGLVSTMLLKDTSDRTVYPVFERGGTAQLPVTPCFCGIFPPQDRQAATDPATEACAVVRESMEPGAARLTFSLTMRTTTGLSLTDHG